MGLAGALCACAPNNERAAAPVAAPQCYASGDNGATWVARRDLPDAELCFEMDSCSGGVGLLGRGCFKWATSADAPAVPWTELGMTPLSRDEAAAEASATPACYYQDSGWRLESHASREARCFALDSCSGGLGQWSGTRCFKWAMAADAPALPWSAALTGPPRLAADVPPPNDIVESVGEATSDCPAEGCNYYGPRRFSVDTPIHARADATAPIIATIPASECVRIFSHDFSTTMRGVVLETFGPLTAGDVVYWLGSEGEGDYSVWRRGETIFVRYDDGPAIRWDPRRTGDPRVGVWFEVTRSSGRIGWTKEARFEEGCTFVRR